jgi:hypothetical protein
VIATDEERGETLQRISAERWFDTEAGAVLDSQVVTVTHDGEACPRDAGSSSPSSSSSAPRRFGIEGGPGALSDVTRST